MVERKGHKMKQLYIFEIFAGIASGKFKNYTRFKSMDERSDDLILYDKELYFVAVDEYFYQIENDKLKVYQIIEIMEDCIKFIVEHGESED